MSDGNLLSDLLSTDEAFAAQWSRLARLSAYARDVAAGHETWVADAWRGGELVTAWRFARVRLRLRTLLREADDEAAILAALRTVRHQELFAIAWRDVNGLASISETLQAQSELAECLLDAALQRASAHLEKRFGTPRGSSNQEVDPVVLGMGKLGGLELNFSSDIDLVFAFSEAGNTDGRRSVSNEEYFARLVRLTVDWLARVTADGFVYRVDLRLRPFGDWGRVALSFAAMEHYYQSEGRDWERYALIKARPVAGNLESGKALLGMLRPFVYRRYLDYSAFESLRQMKAMIESEVARRDMADNVKLGPGGIREIEFVAQAFQLVRGGRDPRLRSTRVLPTLERLSADQHIQPQQCRQLTAAYRFLRLLENRIQQFADQQDHDLPEYPDRLANIAESLGFESTREFSQALAEHRDNVHRIFSTVFQLEDEPHDTGPATAIWQGADSQDELARTLHAAGCQAADQAAEALIRLRRSSQYRLAGARGVELLDRLVPILLQKALSAEMSVDVLQRLTEILATLGRRTAYLSLLWERPVVLERLARLCGESRWIGDAIQQQPALLDDLIDPEPAPERRELLRRIQRGLALSDDPEQKLFSLRRTQFQAMLAIAMDFVDGRRNAAACSKALARVAETVLATALELADQDLKERHGTANDCELAIIGYGTLGGRELTFTSDLDLVFLVDGPLESETDGPNPVTASRYFSRLVQRLLNLLNAITPSGRLYEVDTRLRPNGNSGFLVSSVSAFDRYQTESAWIWELQALTRARPVCGSRRIAEAFADIRSRVLQRPRDPGAVRTEVAQMRERMREERVAAPGEPAFKHGSGGKVDIEFIAQYLRLIGGNRWPELLEQTDTRSGLVAARKAGLLAEKSAERLVEAHDSYQRLGMMGSLQQAAAAEEAWRTHADRVCAAWAEIIEPRSG